MLHRRTTILYQKVALLRVPADCDKARQQRPGAGVRMIFRQLPR